MFRRSSGQSRIWLQSFRRTEACRSRCPRKPRGWAFEGCKGADGEPDPNLFCANCRPVYHFSFWGLQDNRKIKRHFGKIGPCVRPTARAKGTTRKRGSSGAAAACGSPVGVTLTPRMSRSPVEQTEAFEERNTPMTNSDRFDGSASSRDSE